MQAAVWQRQQATVGVALATAGFVAVAPVLPVTSAPAVISAAQRALRLVNADAATADAANDIAATLSTVAGSAAGDSSIFNIPLNLFQQLVNIPYNEIWAMQTLGNSLISSGPWFGASATNIWGEDPGDPLHFMGVIDMLFPFKAISGIDMAAPGVGNNGAPFDPSAGMDPNSFGYVHAFDPSMAANGTLGLGQQVTLLMNQLMPVSASTDADGSIPMFPTTEITGNASIDKLIWFWSSALGVQKFPYFTNLAQPLTHNADGSYTFPTITGDNANTIINGTYTGHFDPTQPISLTNIPPNAQGMIDPSQGPGVYGQINDNNVWQTNGTHPLYVAEGTTLPDGTKTAEVTLQHDFYNPDGTVEFHQGDTVLQVLNDNGNGINLMPWEGMTVKLDFLHPFVNEWNSLTAPIGSDYFSGFTLPSLADIYQAFGTLIAGMLIAFDPFVPGSLFCPGGPCMIPSFLQLPELMKGLNFLFPGNTSIEEWLRLYNTTATGNETGSIYGMANGVTQHQLDAMNMFSKTLNENFDHGNPIPYQINADGLPVDANGNLLDITPQLMASIAYQQALDTPSHFSISPALQAMIDAAEKSGLQDFNANTAHGLGYQSIPDGMATNGGDFPASPPHDWLTQMIQSLFDGNWISQDTLTTGIPSVQDPGILDLLGLGWLFAPAG